MMAICVQSNLRGHRSSEQLPLQLLDGSVPQALLSFDFGLPSVVGSPLLVGFVMHDQPSLCGDAFLLDNVFSVSFLYLRDSLHFSLEPFLLFLRNPPCAPHSASHACAPPPCRHASSSRQRQGPCRHGPSPIPSDPFLFPPSSFPFSVFLSSVLLPVLP